MSTVLVCSMCSTSLDPAADERSGLEALAWVTTVEHGRESVCCPACTREHLRAIEGKLDVAYW
jgi:hypothetical protein